MYDATKEHAKIVSETKKTEGGSSRHPNKRKNSRHPVSGQTSKRG